jgi:hypothetical protein
MELNKSYSDEQIIEVIKLLIDGEGDEKQLAYWQEHELWGLEEVFNLIFYGRENLTPKQILEKARESSKPIFL